MNKASLIIAVMISVTANTSLADNTNIHHSNEQNKTGERSDYYNNTNVNVGSTDVSAEGDNTTQTNLIYDYIQYTNDDGDIVTEAHSISVSEYCARRASMNVQDNICVQDFYNINLGNTLFDYDEEESRLLKAAFDRLINSQRQREARAARLEEIRNK
jgi:hypothetical protein